MFLKLTNDSTASFYNNESIDAESKLSDCFKFNPCHCPDDGVTFCFQTDITDDLRNFLKRFGVQMDEDVAKLQFYLLSNGVIGPCS